MFYYAHYYVINSGLLLLILVTVKWTIVINQQFYHWFNLINLTLWIVGRMYKMNLLIILGCTFLAIATPYYHSVFDFNIVVVHIGTILIKGNLIIL